MMLNYNCASHPNIYIQWLTEEMLCLFFIIYLCFLVYFIVSNIGDKKYKVISLVIILSMFWQLCRQVV